jgi:hypothetical protein
VAESGAIKTILNEMVVDVACQEALAIALDQN